MNFKRPLSISPSRPNQTQNQPTKIGICQVCGDKANIINYGALSCSSCKTFFRRRGFHSKNVYACLSNGNCPITIDTRKSCTACRFEKCRTAGMCPDLIRKEDLSEKQRPSKKSKIKFISREIVTLPQLCSLNLLSNDQSSLTPNNWRLLSNVVHAFDTYNCVPDAKKIVKLVSNLSMKNQTDVQNSLNMMTSIYTSLQTFVNCTADFRIMTTAEQCSLIQRNMQGLLAFYCVFSFRESGVFHNKNTEKALLPLYGYDSVQRTKHICKLLDQDLTLVKLMLITLTFSSNCFMVTEEQNSTRDSLLYGTFRLFGSQNVYAELLWQYMIYRYDYWGAVRRFHTLIKIAVDALSLCSNIYDNNKVHQNLANEITEQIELTLKLNENEDTPLWGKN